MGWFQKSLIRGEPKSGVTFVEGPGNGMALYGGRALPYAELYKQSASVRAVTDFLSQNVASTPIHGWLRSGKGRERLSPRDPLEQLLARPNAKTSGFEFVRDAVADLCIYGNSYAIKVRGDDDRPAALVRIDPQKVSIHRDDDTEVSNFSVHFSGGTKKFPADDVLHLKLYSPDGLLGVSPLESLKAELSEELEAIKYRENFWRNSSRQSGVIERPLDAPAWGDEAFNRFSQSWGEQFAGEGGSGRTAILEDGMRWNAASFSPEQSQYVEARRLTLQNVCAVYGVPLQLLGASERNLDAAQRGLVMNSLTGWFTAIEEGLGRDLVPDVAREQAVFGRVYCEFVVESRNRGNFLQHAKLLNLATGGRPWLHPDEVRAMFNLAPRDDLG